MFVILCFVTKIFSEFLHEVCGHGLFVLLFGGTINSVYINLLWPYGFSYTYWSFTGEISFLQMALIYVGGILTGLCVSFIIQTVLLWKKRIGWYWTISLFWLAFWTFISSAGYLVIGGITCFGDVKELIALGVLSRYSSLFIGLLSFAIGFVMLSWILRKTFMEVCSFKKATLGVSLFWLIIPTLVVIIILSPELSLGWDYFPLSFIPTFLSVVLERVLFLSKQKADKNPSEISEK